MAFLPSVARVGLMMLVQEGLRWKGRKQERERMYESAAYRANELGRPLLLIGDDGIPHQNLRVGAIEVPNNTCVVYCCYCLEKVDDIDDAWSEVMRVAGSPSNIFVSHLNGGIAALAPDIKWKIESAPPLTPALNYRPRSSFVVSPY